MERWSACRLLPLRDGTIYTWRPRALPWQGVIASLSTLCCWPRYTEHGTLLTGVHVALFTSSQRPLLSIVYYCMMKVWVFSWVSAFVSQAAPLKRRLELLRKHSLYFLLVVMSVGQWGESYKMGVCVTLCHWKNFVYFEVELRGGKCKPLLIQVGFHFSHSTVYYALQSILPSFTFEPHQVCTYEIDYSCVCVQAGILTKLFLGSIYIL